MLCSANQFFLIIILYWPRFVINVGTFRKYHPSTYRYRIIRYKISILASLLKSFILYYMVSRSTSILKNYIALIAYYILINK
jgi:hypothetical protein